MSSPDVNSQHAQSLRPRGTVVDRITREQFVMSMHSSNVVSEFVQPREGPTGGSTPEASLSAASVSSSTTMLRLDVTLELIFPSEGPFMFTSRKIALQGCDIVAFYGARARGRLVMGTRDKSGSNLLSICFHARHGLNGAEFALLLACGFFLTHPEWPAPEGRRSCAAGSRSWSAFGACRLKSAGSTNWSRSTSRSNR